MHPASKWQAGDSRAGAHVGELLDPPCLSQVHSLDDVWDLAELECGVISNLVHDIDLQHCSETMKLECSESSDLFRFADCPTFTTPGQQNIDNDCFTHM